MPEMTALVETAGTVSSLFVSGALLAFSAGGVSTCKLAVKHSPVLAAQQWLEVFNRCHKIGTPMVVFSAGCFAWLKYKTNNNVFLAAATSCLCIVPYTLLFLSGPEKILFPAASMKEKTLSSPNPGDVERALGQWGAFNMLRTLFSLAGGMTVLLSKVYGA
ncbi:hypothetical protein BJY01DRAFT_250909 [Aspergillus pseudoustus]|uniref:DUF1772-domain-containing protein n=1 Tax=Aspergillus pseudoustus TaxID=1810923 RepID=A0ABR4JF09_9EURO